MSHLRRLLHWALAAEGSTRGLGLMRICIALMLWARLADYFLIHADSPVHDVVLAATFHLGTLALLVGWHARLASVVCAAVVVYGYHYLLPFEGHKRWNSNNIELLVTTTALLALTPSGRSYSIDRWRALARAEDEGRPRPPEQGPLWGFRLLGLLVSSVYLSTFANKTDWAYLSGERLQSIFATHYTGSTMLDHPAWEGLMMVGATGVWALEGLLIFGLAVPRLRPLVALGGVALHGSFTMLFRVYAFSQNMILLYLPWFPTEQVHDLIGRMAPGGGNPSTRTVALDPAVRIRRRVAVAAVLLTLALAASWDLNSPDSPARVQLLGDRAHTFHRERPVDMRDRNRRDWRDMQRWVRP